MPPFGSVPTTPDPSTSAKASRYRLEPYLEANSWYIHFFLPKGGHTYAKYRDRNGRCIAIFFKSIGVRGRFDSPDPCVAKSCAVRSALRGWHGELGPADPRICSKGHEANSSPGTHSEAPGRSSGAGHQQHPKAENWDSRHMLHQLKGPLPEDFFVNPKRKSGIFPEYSKNVLGIVRPRVKYWCTSLCVLCSFLLLSFRKEDPEGVPKWEDVTFCREVPGCTLDTFDSPSRSFSQPRKRKRQRKHTFGNAQRSRNPITRKEGQIQTNKSTSRNLSI